MRVFRPSRLENPPKTIELKDTINFLDTAATNAIIKVVSAHRPLLDNHGKFFLASSQKTMSIYVYSFETTITFSECHTDKKYHKLVPEPLYPTNFVSRLLTVPFDPFQLAPTFAADQCSFLTLSNFGSVQTPQMQQEICKARIIPMKEDERKKSFVAFLTNYYPSI